MTPIRIIMLSYERGFLKPASEARARLEKLASDETRVTAIVLSHTKKQTHDNGNIRVIGLSGNPVTRFFVAFRTARQEVTRSRKAGETPILSAQDPFIAGKLAFLVSRAANVPYEIQEHADYFSGYWVREVPVIRHVMVWAGRYFLRRADGIRVVSERVRDHVIARGVAPDRVSIIPVAQDVTSLLTREPSGSGDTPTIVVPCRFVKQKGLDVLVDALAILAKQDVAFHARMIGEGSEGPKIADRASKLGIRDRMTFEQWSAPEEIWNNADLFVLSSRYEGWGRTVVEAMASGVPIVATDTGCIGSFFRPQIDGRVVQPNDPTALAAAIREQLAEPARREWMATQARERARSFPSAAELIERQRGAWSRTAALRTPPRGQRTGWKITAALIVFAALIHGLSVALFWPSLGANREWGFFTLIQHFFQGYGYSYAAEVGCVSAYRSPGFLFFLTVVYGLFGFANFFAQAVIQNLLAVLLTYLVYRLGWRVANDRRVGWIAGLLVTLHPYTFYHYTQYYHTVLSGLFLVSLLLSLLALDRTRRFRWAAWTGVMIAALAYVQGTILPAMVFLSFWLLWRWRHAWKRAMVAIGIMAVVSVGLIAPWTIRNWNAFHRFVPLTTDVGLPLYKANTENYEVLLLNGYPHEVLSVEQQPGNPSFVKYTYLPEAQAVLERSGGMKEAAFWTQWHPSEPVNAATCAALPSTSEPDMDAHWKALAATWVKDHFWPDALRLSAEKAVVFWAPVLYPSVRYGAPWAFGNEGVLATMARLSYTGYVAIVELLAIIGVIMLVRRKRLAVAAPLLIVMAVYTLLHSIIAPYTKYRIPLDNLVAVFAAVGAWQLAGWIWKKFRKSKHV